MSFSRGLLGLLLILLLVPGQAQQQPVSADKLEGTALKLPVGTIDLMAEDWTWYDSEGAFASYSSDPDDDTVVAVVYLPVPSTGNLSDMKAMLKSQLMTEASAEEKETLEVTESLEPVFGKTFLYQYKDSESNGAGYVATAEGHTLMVLVTTTGSAVEWRERALKAFHPSAEALKAKNVTSTGFLARTEAIPANRLESSSTLRIPGGRLEAPGPDWKWRQISAGGQTVYICHKSVTDFIAVGNSLRSEDMSKFVEGLGKGMSQKAGPALKDEVKYSAAELPFAGNSKRADMTYRVGDEVVLQGVALFGTDGTQSLAIVGLGLEPLEAEVEKVTQSFRKDPEARIPSGGAVAFVLGGLVVVLIGIVNLIARRPLLNGGKIALVVTALVALPTLTVALKTATPYEAGRAFGSFFWPILLFAWLANLHTKKREAFKERS